MFSGGSETSVDDALIRSDGSVIKFHPNDSLLAMQDFGNLQIPSGGGGSGKVDISGEFVITGDKLRRVINESIYINP